MEMGGTCFKVPSFVKTLINSTAGLFVFNVMHIELYKVMHRAAASAPKVRQCEHSSDLFSPRGWAL